mgnify:FL=1
MLRVQPVGIAVVILLIGVSAEGQETSKFGTDWPGVKDCLKFTEETGDWRGGGVKYRFLPDGTFEASYSLEYANDFQRRRQRMFRFTGTWDVDRRVLSKPEMLRLQLDPSVEGKFYVLAFHFKQVEVTPPFRSFEKFSDLFPKREGGPLDQTASLVLDEFNNYAYPGTRDSGPTDPRCRHCIVISHELG